MFPRLGIAETLGLRRTPLPRLGTRLTRRGNGVEPPRFAAGRHVIGCDEASDAVLAAAHANDHLVLHDQRRVRDRVPGFSARHLGLPDGTAGSPIDRNQLRVEGPHEQRVAKDPKPAIVGAATDDAILGRCVAVDPERPTGCRVEGDDVVQTLRDVHHAVDDQRRGLPVAGNWCLVHPLELQILDVGWSDLIERAVARARVVAGVRQPVLGFARRACEAFGRYLSMDAERQHAHQRYDPPRDGWSPSDHGYRPFSESRYATTSPISSSESLPLYDGMGEVFEIVNSRRSAFITECRISWSSMI